jgi:AcrR family transcriptional regulator
VRRVSGGGTADGTRPLRADAARNREALLEAARDVFAVHGSGVGAAQLVRDSGMSKAALFRHFRTKQELFLEVLAEDARTLGDRLALAADLPDPAEAFRAFMVQGAEHMVENRGLLEATSGQMFDAPRVRAMLATVADACDRVLERAQRAGVAREDLVGLDLLLLFKAPAGTVMYLEDAAPQVWRRYLDLLLDGLRPEGARPLGTPAPSPAGLPGLGATTHDDEFWHRNEET